MRIGFPGNLGDPVISIHYGRKVRTRLTKHQACGGVATDHHRSNEAPAQPVWYHRAKETEPEGRITGSLSLFIVPVESRVTYPRGACE